MIHFATDITVDSATMTVKVNERSKEVERRFSQGIHSGLIYLQTVLRKDVLSGQVLRRRTGNLSRAVFTKMDEPLSGFVGIGREAPYALFLDKGSRPHVIEAPAGKALAFTPSAGAIRSSAFVPRGSFRRTLEANKIFRQRVNHPGNPPYKFMELALHIATPGIRQRIETALAMKD